MADWTGASWKRTKALTGSSVLRDLRDLDGGCGGVVDVVWTGGGTEHAVVLGLPVRRGLLVRDRQLPQPLHLEKKLWHSMRGLDQRMSIERESGFMLS